MKRTLFTLLTLTIFSLSLAPIARAAVRCESQYGGGEVCYKTGEIQLNKQVYNPDSSSFVDNLSVNTHYFKGDQEITFRIKVKNVGDKTLDSVHVKDYLPSYLHLTSGDLDYHINDLSVGETDEREIKVKVVDEDDLPSQSITCVVNRAEAWADDEHDSDTSQVCLKRYNYTTTTTTTYLPATGPKFNQLIALLALGCGALGIYLLKRAKSL